MHLASLVPIPVLPHLMNPALARLHGIPGKASRKIDLLPSHPWPLSWEAMTLDFSNRKGRSGAHHRSPNSS
ncbi:hypothetical protein ACWX0K_11935 [Nitrobacteraceae bacterium UC4446_H13]